jgi:hypothetical protein
MDMRLPKKVILGLPPQKDSSLQAVSKKNSKMLGKVR